MMTKPLLIAFDFDNTVVEDNTDLVIIRLLKNEKARSQIRGLDKTEVWTIYMRKVFELIHENGATKNDIENAIRNIRAVDGFPSMMENLHSRNVEIIIISDSNTIFINLWLKHQKLDHTINEVFTNPAYFDERGLLKIDMYHVQDRCKLCSKNMCKGAILENYIERRSKEGITFKKIAYAGDGKNDLCPMLRLATGDLAFPRISFALSKILEEKKNNGQVPKAEVILWKNGGFIWQELVKRISDLDCEK